MAIRSDIVEEAGLTTDDFKDITWFKFMELAKTVKEKTDIPMLTTSGGSELILEMLQSAGASPIVDGEVKIADNEVLKQAVEVYAQLVNEGYMTEYTDWDQYIASMNNGDAAGVINGCWIMSSVQAAESDVYQEASDFYGGQKVYADIVDYASKVPAFDCGAYYSDIRSALTDVVTNVVQSGADVAEELQTAQETVEFNIEG